MARLCYGLGYSLFSYILEYRFKKNSNHKVCSLIMIDILLKYLGLEISNRIKDLDLSLLQISNVIWAKGFWLIEIRYFLGMYYSLSTR